MENLGEYAYAKKYMPNFKDVQSWNVNMNWFCDFWIMIEDL
jgi:hypothetical protein